MPRRTRIFVSGGIYHVYCRVARGEPVFQPQFEIDEWVNIVASISRLHDLTILAWALLSTHYHLVFRTKNMPLWKAMAAIQGRVAKGYNFRRGVKGRLWQSRYRARIVQGQHDLDHLLAYVHLNTVAAGIVEDPLDYAQCGHAELMGYVEPRLCDVNAALMSFDENIVNARAIYEVRLRTVAEIRWLSTGVRHLPWWQTVKDDNETLPKDQAPPTARDFAGQPLAPDRHLRPDLRSVLHFFEKENDLPRGQLSGCSRAPLLSWYRCLFATFAVSWLGYSSKDVGFVLNKASGSISRWVSQGLELQRSELSFRLVVDGLGIRFGHEWPESDLA